MAVSIGPPCTLISCELPFPTSSINDLEASTTLFKSSRSSLRRSSPSFLRTPIDEYDISLVSFILPSVSVPVLSVKIIVVAPSVSAAKRFLTSPPRFRMLSMPIARTIDTAAGSPSGMVATAIAIDIRRRSAIGCPRRYPSTKIEMIEKLTK